MGDYTQKGHFYLACLFCLMPLGYILKRFDTLILVFAFVLQGQIESGVTRLFFMYTDIVGDHIPSLALPQ